MPLAQCYRYLGLMLDENTRFSEAIEVLGNSAGRALGGLITMSRSLGDPGLWTNTKLYNSCVASIPNKGSAMCGAGKDTKPEVV